MFNNDNVCVTNVYFYYVCKTNSWDHRTTAYQRSGRNVCDAFPTLDWFVDCTWWSYSQDVWVEDDEWLVSKEHRLRCCRLPQSSALPLSSCRRWSDAVVGLGAERRGEDYTAVSRVATEVRRRQMTSWTSSHRDVLVTYSPVSYEAAVSHTTDLLYIIMLLQL